MTPKTALDVAITFDEPLLGSASGNLELHEEFIAAKAPTIESAKEEMDALQVAEEIQKASTIFPKDETGLFLYDYQWRGFFKEALGVLVELGEVTGCTKWTLKKAVDSLVFVRPRRIYLLQPDGTPWKAAPETLQRPLRCETMKGERVALARSETLPAGTQAKFSVSLFAVTNGKSKWRLTEADLKAALDYGAFKGMGQWRSGGFGRFSWK